MVVNKNRRQIFELSVHGYQKGSQYLLATSESKRCCAKKRKKRLNQRDNVN